MSLLLSELAMAAAVVSTAVVALSRLGEEHRYMNTYVFAPLLDIAEALSDVDAIDRTALSPPADLRDGARGAVLRLRGFLNQYQSDWETGGSSRPEAVRLRAILARDGLSSLVDQEHEAVGECAHALTAIEGTLGLTRPDPAPRFRQEDLVELQGALVRLTMLNQRYVQVTYKGFEQSRQLATTVFFAVSLAGIVAATAFGLAIRRAVGPRVQRMVTAVEDFRERGSITPIVDDGEDDLALLARTLTLSLRSIAERDQERERFLAHAAHELKTPLTTLKGYAQIALTHHDDEAVRTRALTVIERQSTRLARLVQDLLWAARANAGALPFHPAPIDLTALARRVIAEVEVICPRHRFELTANGSARMLGDSTLLEHSLWSMLVQVVAVAADQDPVHVAIDDAASRVGLSVTTRFSSGLPPDAQELAEPFSTPPFEGGGDGRTTGLGLHVVTAIARLHGARFFVTGRTGGTFGLYLELFR